MAMLFAVIVLLSQTGIAASQPRPPTASVAEILANPAAYAGKPIRLHGFLILEFEGNGLWQDEAAFREDRYEQSLWVQSNALTQTRAEATTGRLVYLSGTFNPTQKGHMGLRAGAIENVSAIALDPADRQPSRSWRTDPNFSFLFALLSMAAVMAALLAFGVVARRATARR
jgi:hypothetical protein